jgi:hypothetical protein
MIAEGRETGANRAEVSLHGFDGCHNFVAIQGRQNLTAVLSYDLWRASL